MITFKWPPHAPKSSHSKFTSVFLQTPPLIIIRGILKLKFYFLDSKYKIFGKINKFAAIFNRFC